MVRLHSRVSSHTRDRLNAATNPYSSSAPSSVSAFAGRERGFAFALFSRGGSSTQGNIHRFWSEAWTFFASKAVFRKSFRVNHRKTCNSRLLSDRTSFAKSFFNSVWPPGVWL